MPKNKVVSLAVFRKNRRLDNNRLAEPPATDTSSCSLCPNQLELDDPFGQCCACREAQQAALRAYGLCDDAE
jgi:hypothetical protein